MTVSTPARPKARISIDPRLRARRIEVRREEGRKRLRRLVAFLAVLALLFVGAVLTRTPLLDVDQVRVTGTAHTTADQILAASGIERGDAMTDADLNAAQDRIAALPWVESVDVSRRWPGTIIIKISERAAVAVAVGPTGQWLTIDGAGRVVEVTDAPPPGLPRLTDLVFAASAAGAVLEGDLDGVLRLATLLPADLRPAVAIVRAGESGLELALVAGGRAVIGSTDDLEAKLVALETMLTHVDPRCVVVLDVQVPGTPVLTRTGNCANLSTATGG